MAILYRWFKTILSPDAQSWAVSRSPSSHHRSYTSKEGKGQLENWEVIVDINETPTYRLGTWMTAPQSSLGGEQGDPLNTIRSCSLFPLQEYCHETAVKQIKRLGYVLLPSDCKWPAAGQAPPSLSPSLAGLWSILPFLSSSPLKSAEVFIRNPAAHWPWTSTLLSVSKLS